MYSDNCCRKIIYSDVISCFSLYYRKDFMKFSGYPSAEVKAAHLLYFVIKDHPFTDGNKRIGSFLFLYFLQINGLLDDQCFDNKALVALTLLTASSDPNQKDLLIRLIINLLAETEECG